MIAAHQHGHMTKPFHVHPLALGFLGNINHVGTQRIRAGLHQQSRTAESLPRARGTEQTRYDGHKLIQIPDLMQDTQIPVRIIPAHGELNTAVDEAAAQ